MKSRSSCGARPAGLQRPVAQIRAGDYACGPFTGSGRVLSGAEPRDSGGRVPRAANAETVATVTVRHRRCPVCRERRRGPRTLPGTASNGSAIVTRGTQSAVPIAGGPSNRAGSPRCRNTVLRVGRITDAPEPDRRLAEAGRIASSPTPPKAYGGCRILPAQEDEENGAAGAANRRHHCAAEHDLQCYAHAWDACLGRAQKEDRRSLGSPLRAVRSDGCLRLLPIVSPGRERDQRQYTRPLSGRFRITI